MKGKRWVVLFVMICAIVTCLVFAAGCGSGGKEAAPSGTTGTEAGDASQVAACLSNLRSIDSAISQYKLANGRDPRTLEDLVPTYLRSIPREPMGGTYSIIGGKAVCSEGHSY